MLFTITNDNLTGVRKVAHYCLILALNGAFYQTLREQKAAKNPTIDSYNELEDGQDRPAPYGLEQERSPWTKFAGLYFELAARIASFNNKYVLAMKPEAMWEFLSTSSEHPHVSEDMLKQVADACGYSLEDTRMAMKAALVQEDNKRVSVTEAVLSLVHGMQDAGTIEDMETLTADEQLRLVQKFMDGLIDHRAYLFRTGRIFRDRNAMNQVAVIKADLDEAAKEITRLEQLAEAA